MAGTCRTGLDALALRVEQNAAGGHSFALWVTFVCDPKPRQENIACDLNRDRRGEKQTEQNGGRNFFVTRVVPDSLRFQDSIVSKECANAQIATQRTHSESGACNVAVCSCNPTIQDWDLFTSKLIDILSGATDLSMAPLSSGTRLSRQSLRCTD